VLADEAVAERSRRRRDVPVQTSGTWNNVEVAQPPASRHHPASTQDDGGVPAKSSTVDRDGAVERPGGHVRSRRLRVRTSKTDQRAFELDNGPQGTSTPSPTYERRELLQTAAPAVPSPAAPPPPSPKAAAGSQPRPVFEPVVSAVASGSDQFPVSSAQPALQSCKPDVISDVMEDVAEPLRPAPRTDRHRQRTSGAWRGAADEQLQQQKQVREPSTTSDTDDEDEDDDESSRSDASGEFLLQRQRSSQGDKVSSQQPPITGPRQPHATTDYQPRPHVRIGLSRSSAVAAERRKYWGSESMGGYGEGAVWVALSHRWVRGCTPGKFCQKPAFSFVIGKKMCLSHTTRSVLLTTCYGFIIIIITWYF